MRGAGHFRRCFLDFFSAALPRISPILLARIRPVVSTSVAGRLVDMHGPGDHDEQGLFAAVEENRMPLARANEGLPLAIRRRRSETLRPT